MYDQLRLHRHEDSGQRGFQGHRNLVCLQSKQPSKNRTQLQCDVLLEDQRTYCCQARCSWVYFKHQLVFICGWNLSGNRCRGFPQGWNVPASICPGYVDTIQMWYGDKTATYQGSENTAQTSQRRSRAPTVQSGDWYKDYSLNVSKINQQIQTNLNIFCMLYLGISN